MLALIAILQLTVSQTGGPVLRVSPGPVPPCPDLTVFLEAVRTRSPAVTLEERGAPGPGDLAVSIGSSPASWRLEVRRAEGALAMARDLDTVGFACEELSDTAALMIDRLLEQLDWHGNAAPMEPLGLAVAPGAPAPPPKAPWLTGLELFAGGSARAGLALAPTPGVSIEVAARSAAWRLGGWVQAEGSSTTEVRFRGEDLGDFTTRSFLGGLSLQRCRPAGPLEACGGLMIGGELTIATAQGERLYRKTPQTAWAAMAGGGGRLGYPLTAALVLSADLALAVRVGAGANIEGTEVGYSPLLGAVGSLRLGWSFF